MNRQIAAELNVSNRTIERRRASILKQLNAATTWEMVSKLVEREMLRSWSDNSGEKSWQMARNAHRVIEALAV